MTGQRVHIMGAGGWHMSAIARILHASGARVDGCDRNPAEMTEALEREGITVLSGHDPAHVHDLDLFVHTAAVKRDHPEVQAALAQGVEVLVRAEMVARLLQGKRTIGAAGTHGKTTTSTMMAYILHQAGLDPTYLLGGVSVDLGTNAKGTDSDVAVIEADEFAAAFLEYAPFISIVTNVEADHLDYYKTFENYRAAFRKYLANTVESGLAVVCTDSEGVRQTLADEGAPITAKLHTYGIATPATWTAQDVAPNSAGGMDFTVLLAGKGYDSFATRIPGEHNVLNALACIASADWLGVDRWAVREALQSFRGAHRRFELLGEAKGVTVMDDFAHHPTEIAVTLANARRRFPGRRLVAVFQPYTYTRTDYLFDELSNCFQDVDELVVLETYAAREEPWQGRSAEELTANIRHPANRTYEATYEGSADEAVRRLRPGDVFFTLGCGDPDRVAHMVLEKLTADS
jgi:UDP-N-acetylmuramate--alanine ligase